MSAGTIDGTAPPATGGTAQPLAPAPRRRWLRRSAAAVGLLLGISVITGAIWAAHYQPVGLGHDGTQVMGQIVTRQVNDFGLAGQIYIPPQGQHRGFVYVSLVNSGGLPVAIEAATLNPPGLQDRGARQDQALRDSGSPAGQPEIGPGSQGQLQPLAGMTLRPGEDIHIRLPVITAGCWAPANNGPVVVSQFYVTMKFGIWTHNLTVVFTQPDLTSGAIMARQAEPRAAGGGCL